MRLSRLGTALVCVLAPLLALALPVDAQRIPLRFPSLRHFPMPGAARSAAGNGLVYAPQVPQPRGDGEVVGAILRNVSRANLHNQPISFGQVFVAGKVPQGSGLTARIDDMTVPAQMDAKAFNPDGSVRMAVVTVAAPSLSAGARVPVIFSLGSQPAGEVSLANLPNYNLSVDIALSSGRTYHLDAGQLLTAELAARKPSYWLRGPLATEIRVDKPVVGSLHVTFDIRAFANGTTLTDVEFKNDYALQAQGGPLTYDVTISSGGATVFSQQNVTQLQYTHWHKLVGPGGPNETVVVHDIAALERANAILDYDLGAGVRSNVIARDMREMQGEGFGILQNAGLAWYMGQTGGRGDIGPTTQANTIWLLTQDPDAQAYALAQADAGGTIAWHFYHPQSSSYLSASRFPQLWTDARAAREGLPGLTQQIAPYSKTCSCFYLDAAHQPDVAYVPYLLTGERYYLDQLEAQSSWDVIGWNPRYREFDRAIVFFPDTQARAQAWSFRGIINAAWILPDEDPLKSYFARVQANNLNYLLKEIATLHEGEAYGWIPANGGLSSPTGHIIPWQQDFIAYVMALAAKRGDPLAIKVLQWQTNYLAGRFLADSKGLSPFDAAGYRMVAFTPPNQITGAFKTWAQIGHATAAAGFTAGGSEWPKDTYAGYIQAAKGVLAQIARITNSAEARRAHEWLDQNAGKGDINRDQIDPTWRIASPD